MLRRRLATPPWQEMLDATAPWQAVTCHAGVAVGSHDAVAECWKPFATPPWQVATLHGAVAVGSYAAVGGQVSLPRRRGRDSPRRRGSG